MGTPTGGSRIERTKLSMLRRKVAERIAAKRNGYVNYFNEVNMTPINIRNQYKDEFKAKTRWCGSRYMSFGDKSIKIYPDVNSMMDGDYKIAYDSVIYLSHQDQRFNGSCCS
jgi:2-oxoglutarate dehydrogenase E2 component (dihydrolipoamide succinyltransferase)